MSEPIFAPIENYQKNFQNSLKDYIQYGDKSIEVKYLYIPSTHSHALNPDKMLVEGMRGAGKSVWWSALQSESHLKLISSKFGLSIIPGSPGFGQSPSEHYPDKQTLGRLLSLRYSPQELWKTIVVWNILGNQRPRLQSWEKRISWLKEHPEEVGRGLLEKDRQIQNEKQKHLILFDALDRTADDWQTLRSLLKGLLQVLLEFRSYQAIRLKAFVRPDMLNNSAIAAFPDGSKVLSDKVTLDWSRRDLYGLLWQHLGNEESFGEEFRKMCQKHYRQKWTKEQAVWIVPNEMCRDEDLQKRLFHSLVGPYMGKGRNRGYPYPWVPNHLADAFGKVSPRSFLAALHTASLEESVDYSLHYNGIKKGIQQASQIRVNELKEDYPWIDKVLQVLTGQTVPCEFSRIKECWEQQDILAKLRDRDGDLPPSRIEEGAEGVKQDLVDLGIFQKMHDGRINMPEVYRVGYGLGRKGGVQRVK